MTAAPMSVICIALSLLPAFINFYNTSYNFFALGATCTDPGYPAGGSITVNGFEQNGYVTFKCDRNGFAPSRNTGIGCVLNNFGNGLTWNDTVPQCVGMYNLYDIIDRYFCQCNLLLLVFQETYLMQTM